MTTILLMFDVAPEPVSTGTSVVVLILTGIVALMITAAALLGFVFGLRAWLRTRTSAKAGTRPAPEFQPSNPNQP